MFQCEKTLTNLPTMLGGRAKQYEYQTATKCSQCPKGLIIQQPNQSKGSVQNAKSQPAQKRKGLPNNVASLYAHSRARTH